MMETFTVRMVELEKRIKQQREYCQKEQSQRQLIDKIESRKYQ